MAKMWSHELRGNMIHHCDTTTLDGELQGGYKKHGPRRSFHGDMAVESPLIPWRKKEGLVLMVGTALSCCRLRDCSH